MSGVSSPVGIPWNATYLGIRIEPKPDKVTYWIDQFDYNCSIQANELVAFSEEALKAFNNLRIGTNAGIDQAKRDSRPLVEGLTLSEAARTAHLEALGEFGYRAYWGFFSDAVAQQTLADRFTAMAPWVPAPTFLSTALFFPWELLYEGKNKKSPDPEKFWGFRYAPARVLDRRDPSTVKPQDVTPDMLFCLHRSLRQAQHEWSDIRNLVAALCAGRIHMLGPSFPAEPHADGEELLNYLIGGQHNMIHFACHATQGSAGKDVLQISCIDPAELENLTARHVGSDDIELGTDDFIAPPAEFRTKPLVMLNACQSAGGHDELRVYYNLPQQFIKRGAAAVIATACPVPDVFAAEFARVFYEYFLIGTDPLAGNPTPAATGPLTIGEALRRTRRYFLLKHRNPLGLAYGLYSPAHYQVARPPAAGGATA